MVTARIVIPPSTAAQVHGWLRRRVQQGVLPLGTSVSETEIAATIGTSRQPVREAFIHLANKGLAEIRPQRGAFVSRISVSAVLSARFIRAAVEVVLAWITAASCSMDVLTGRSWMPCGRVIPTPPTCHAQSSAPDADRSGADGGGPARRFHRLKGIRCRTHGAG